MAMTERRRRMLERNGWKVGTVAEFLRLTPQESALIELRFALADALKATRVGMKLSQSALARKLESSQSRVAKMESGDPSVSLDLMIRALMALGVELNDIGKAFQTKRAVRAKRRRAA